VVLTSWVNVDVKRDMTRVCARVLIEERGGRRSVGNGRMMDLVWVFLSEKEGNGARQSPGQGKRDQTVG
jgi:hypothetical protein